MTTEWNVVKICVRVADFCFNIMSAIFSSRFELCVVILVHDSRSASYI